MKIFQISFATILIALFASISLPTQAEIAFSQSFEMLENCPTASFSIANNGALAGIPIYFTNQSTGATSYLWDFGDGHTSTDVNPSHVYGSAGTYTVKLYATFGGCTVAFIGTEDVIIH